MAGDRVAAALEEIREREQSATEGPWQHGFAPNGGPLVETTWLVTEGYVGAGMTKRVAYLMGTAGKHEQEVANARFIAAAREDVPRLLAAVDAALGHHKRDPLYGNAATEDEPGNCPHDPDSPLHFEAGDGSGEWLCEGRPEGAVCSTCIDGEGGERIDWPCPECRAIAEALGVSVAELTGEDKPDDQ